MSGARGGKANFKRRLLWCKKTAFEKVGYGLMCENRLLVTPHTTLLRVLLADGAQTVELRLLGP